VALAALQCALYAVERLDGGPEQDQLLGDLIRRQRGALHFLQDIRRPTLDFLLRQRPRVESLEDASIRSLYYLWLGRLATPLGEFAISQEAAERAIEAAERSGDKIVAAGARSVLSHAYFWRGRARAGLEAALQAVEILEGTGELYWLGYAWRGVSMNRMNTSDFIGAAEAARRVGAIGDALDDDFFRFTGAWVPAVLLLTTADAETVTTAMRRVLDGAPTAFETAQAAMCLGLVYLDTDRPHEAISWLEPLVVNPDRLRQRHVVGVCGAYLAEAHLEAGHLERAATVAADACRLGRETGYAHGLGYALRVMARVAAARRVAAEGERHAAEADGIYEVMGSPFERARIAWARAELARARGEHDVALRHFAEAIDGLRASGAPRYADRVEAIRNRGA
jgi:tetratricopeptide (TPR) repeat protein